MVFHEAVLTPKARTGSLWECCVDATMLGGCYWYLVDRSPGRDGSHNVSDSTAPGGVFLVSCIFIYPLDSHLGKTPVYYLWSPETKSVARIKSAFTQF